MDKVNELVEKMVDCNECGGAYKLNRGFKAFMEGK